MPTEADARDPDPLRTDGEVGPGRPDRRLRVLVLGLRGFPDVEGGVEAHAQNLYPRLVQLGCDVEVVVRSPYVAKESPRSWRGVRFRRVWAPKVQGHEAAVHSLLAVLLAGARRPDVVHIHAIGSAMWAPLARLLGLKVVVTHHSLNYEHEKWGRGARALLRFGEFAGMRYSHGRIAIARPIAELMPERYGVSVRFIPNGVELPPTRRRQRCHQALRPRARPLPALRRSPHAREAPARPDRGLRPARGCPGGSWCWSAPTARTTATPPRSSSRPSDTRASSAPASRPVRRSASSTPMAAGSCSRRATRACPSPCSKPSASGSRWSSPTSPATGPSA